jgi:TetR/AcrR family transcriptional repressor of nem operon
MKVSREQVAIHRRRILEAASVLFRESGFDAIGVDAVMKEAGLTHGGFYGHFESKEDLIAQACAHGLAMADDSWTASADPIAALAAAYLNQEHCDNPGEGCVLAALGADVARQGTGVRHAFTDGFRLRIDQLARLMPGRSRAARRRRAIATWAGLAGAMVLARAVDDPALSREIQKAGVATFGEKPPDDRRRVRARRVRARRAAAR